jgi:hypothetical protein
LFESLVKLQIKNHLSEVVAYQSLPQVPVNSLSVHAVRKLNDSWTKLRISEETLKLKDKLWPGIILNWNSKNRRKGESLTKKQSLNSRLLIVSSSSRLKNFRMRRKHGENF